MDSQSKWAKPEEWDKYKNTISALFMCHSLPNVMRIMREDHDFHATPKMYQVHIYQKWGLRKGRPEPKTKKKRRREPSEEPDEGPPPPRVVELDEDEDAFPEDEESNHGSHHSNSTHSYYGQPSVASTNPSSLLTNPTTYPSVGSHGFGNEPPIFGSIPGIQVPTQPIQAPLAYRDFLNSHRPPSDYEADDHPRPGGLEGAPFPVTAIMPDGQIVQMNMNPNAQPGSWMSTVLSDSEVAKSNARTNGKGSGSQSSRRSKTSKSSSRPSQASSSRSTLLSSQSSLSQSSRASKRSNSRMTLPPGTIRHLQAPDSLLSPEKSMFYARHYISSTFSTGLWTLSQNTDPSLLDTEAVKLDQWYNDFNPGLELMYEGRYDSVTRIPKAFGIFQRCFAATKDIIVPQDPRIVIYMCQQAIRFMYYDTLGRNLSRVLLQYVATLCKELFGESHPLYIIIFQLSRMDNFEFARNIPALMDCYFDHLEPFIEPETQAYCFVNELRGLTVSIMEATGMMGIYEAQPKLDVYIKRAQKYNHNDLQLKIECAAMLQRSRFYEESRQMLVDIRSPEAARKHPYQYVYAGVILLVVLRKMKHMDAVINLGYSMRDFLTLLPAGNCSSDFDMELFKVQMHSSLVVVLGKLEKDLRDTGRLEEAAVIHAQLDATISSQYGVDSLTADPDAELGAVG